MKKSGAIVGMTKRDHRRDDESGTVVEMTKAGPLSIDESGSFPGQKKEETYHRDEVDVDDPAEEIDEANTRTKPTND